jgi:hypothetical protein
MNAKWCNPDGQGSWYPTLHHPSEQKSLAGDPEIAKNAKGGAPDQYGSVKAGQPGPD